MIPAWLALSLAIVLEVSGTTCLKLAEGFSRPLPTAGVVVFYITSFFMLGLALRTMNVGTAYAIWAGVGTALVTVIGIVAFKEPATAVRFGCITLIIAGVVGLHLFEAPGGGNPLTENPPADAGYDPRP